MIATKKSAAAPEPAASMPVFGGAADSYGAGGGRVTVEAKKGAAEKRLKADTGREAVNFSEAIGKYKDADHADREIAPAVKTVGRKIFYLLDGVWTDRDYKKEMKEIRVKYAGDEYFKLLEKHPDLKKYFALGEKVIVCLDDKTAVIVEAAE
jgi:hypothetical protein